MEQQAVQLVEVTWSRALKVWWSLTWRGLIAGLLGGIVGGVIGGVLSGILMASGVINRNMGGVYGGWLGFFLGFAAYIYVVKMVLHLKYKGFRIALIATEE